MEATIVVEGVRQYQSAGNILNWVHEAQSIAQATTHPTVSVYVAGKKLCSVSDQLGIRWIDRHAKQDYDARYAKAYG